MDTPHAPTGLGRRLTWTTYGLMLAQGFAVYSVSYITPYMESELGAPTWASSAPNAGMAVGFLAAAAVVPMVVRLAGPRAAVRIWALGVALAALLVASAASIAVVVAGAFLVGLASAGAIVHTVSALGALSNGLYLVRSTVWSMVGALLGPLALWVAVQTTGWSTGVLVVLPLALAVALLVVPSPAQVAEARVARRAAEAVAAARKREKARPLGSRYWMAWTYLVLAIGAEFAFVAWGARMTVARTGIALADATALASLFVVGELAGRFAWGAGIGAGADRVRTLQGMTLVALAGAVVVWASPSPAAAGIGLLLAGLGAALVFPISASLAVAYAAHAPLRASARLNLSWGVAILCAPLLLGIAADAMGVTTASILVLGLLGAAMAVILRLPRPDAVGAASEPVEPSRPVGALAG